MTVSYMGPLRSAWSRMLRMLFRPFRIEVWLVLGFAAFLSEYLAWGFPGARGGFHVRGDRFPLEALRRTVDFLSHPLAATVALWIAFCALAVIVLFMWISSRGMFIFLDNVAHERTGIVEPWRRFKRLGNSLFLWRLVFGAVCLVVVGAMLVPFLAVIAAVASEETFHPAQLLVLLPLASMFLPFAIVFAYILLFLTSFVVPIMYRFELGASAAWGRFLRLFWRQPWPFLLYGLFVLAITIVAGFGVLAIGMATCCVGFALLSLPYVGSVLMLPLEVTARAMGPEFLFQFGADLTVFGTSEPAGGPGAGGESSPAPGPRAERP